MSTLTVEPAGQDDLSTCDCCGNPSRTVWGLVRESDLGAYAAYFVHWTPGRVPQLGAHFDVVIGAWGDGTTVEDREAVSLEFRHVESGPGFMIVDAKTLGHGDLARRSLTRAEVMGTEKADAVFKIVDAVWLQDARLKEIRDAAA